MWARVRVQRTEPFDEALTVCFGMSKMDDVLQLKDRTLPRISDTDNVHSTSSIGVFCEAIKGCCSDIEHAAGGGGMRGKGCVSLEVRDGELASWHHGRAENLKHPVIRGRSPGAGRADSPSWPLLPFTVAGTCGT